MSAEGQSQECEVAEQPGPMQGSCNTTGEAVGACAATFLMVLRIFI